MGEEIPVDLKRNDTVPAPRVLHARGGKDGENKDHKGKHELVWRDV